MTHKSFSEVTKQVNQLTDLIISDVICGSNDNSEEFLSFSRHLHCTKHWFVRISWANKRRFILALMEDLHSAWALSLLLKSMWNCHPKDAVISSYEHRPWSVYDQAPMDHNRTALPIVTLAQVMTNDRKWFHLLSPESQALVLTELLTIAGGPVMWEVLRRGQLIYENHRERQLNCLLDCMVLPNQTNQAQNQPAASSKMGLSDKSGEKLHHEARRDNNANRPSYDDTTFHSPRPVEKSASLDQAQKQLDASLAAWNDAIKALRDSQKLEELEMTFKDGSCQRIWRVNRPQPEAIETVDYLQLLPSEVGKRILSFIPPTSYPDLARVNKYWSYLIDDYKTELVARPKLNTDLQKLQNLVLIHDISNDDISYSRTYYNRYSIEPSVTINSRRVQASYKASERSAGSMSFRQVVVDKLNPKHKLKFRPIKRMSDLTKMQELRGAADENLWQWCKKVLKFYKGKHPQPNPEEGIIRCQDVCFPCPLMKYNLEVPLPHPLVRDPAYYTVKRKKELRKNFSYPLVIEAKQPDKARLSLWSRDLSSLYKVYKVPSYKSPERFGATLKNK